MNLGFKYRHERTNNSGEVRLVLSLGQIPLFAQAKNWPPQVRIQIKLRPSDTDYFLQSAAAAKIVFAQKPILRTYHPMAYPDVVLPTETLLAKEVAPYDFENYKRVIQTVPIGVTSHDFTLVQNGPIPRKIILFLQRQNRFDGMRANSPFIYERHNLTEIRMTGDGGEETLRLLEPEDAWTAYNNFIRGREVTGDGTAMSKELWQGAYNAYVINLSPDQGLRDDVHFPMPKGNVDFRLKFSQATGYVIKATYIMQFDGRVEIDMAGTCNYTEAL